MVTSTRPATQGATPIHDPKWSPTEKSIAHKAFDLALGREFEAVIQEAKKKASRIEQPSDLWELEDWLTQRRKEIDRKYDFRYSVLPLVFAYLIRDGYLSEGDLSGLGEDKLDRICRVARMPYKT